MNLSDTFYVALCMAVLMLGVVYWFWTQNQYIQRKLNLLENIVYEMRSSSNFNERAPDPVEKALAAAAEMSVVPDVTPFELAAAAAGGAAHLDDDDIDHVLNSLETKEVEQHNEADADIHVEQTSEAEGTPVVADELFEDLAPGGIAGFADNEDVSDTNNESVLNAMGLKELRELAKQKGVSGTKTLRKHELVAAIRASKTSVTPFEIREGTLELN